MDRKLIELIDNFCKNPKNVNFNDLVQQLSKLFGTPTVRGSHHIFRTSLPPPHAVINLQRIKKEAKPYQVKQVRAVLAILKTPPEESGE